MLKYKVQNGKRLESQHMLGMWWTIYEAAGQHLALKGNQWRRNANDNSILEAGILYNSAECESDAAVHIIYLCCVQ